MEISVVRPHDLEERDLAAWRAMQRSSPEFANPFLSPDFTLVVGRVRPEARVAVLQEGPDAVGFFAFEQRRFRVGRPIAAGICDSQAVVHVPGLDWSARDLLKGCGLDVLEFDHLIGGQISAVGGKMTPRRSAIIDVSGGYEAHLERWLATSRKTIKSTRYKQRKLERDLAGIRFEFDTHDPAALRTLLRWKSQQYRRTGQRDRFAIAWIERVVSDLFETRFDGCAGTLSVLYAAERVIAAHFGLRSDSKLSYWFPAYDRDLARYSPGLILILGMAERAAMEGIQCLDLGKGDEDYKQWLQTGEIVVGEGWVERPSAAALAFRFRRTPRRVAIGFTARHPTVRSAVHAARRLRG